MKLEIDSMAPNISHGIEYNGVKFVLTLDGGFWGLWNMDGTPALAVGRRSRWQDALRDSLIFIANQKKALEIEV